MPCFHKFFGHPNHLPGENGLLPPWKVKTLFIGTFNPETTWHPSNAAQYFYGRPRNYFWKAVPKFACSAAIGHSDVQSQIEFLIKKEIGLTDLLININDADILVEDHRTKIISVLDSQIERFNDFTWNTTNIIRYINDSKVEAVYFTKLGMPNVGVGPNTFEAQMRLIEQACMNRDVPVPSFRLHSPSGMGLGRGVPKLHVLMHRWYHENGGIHFPFLGQGFNINNFPYLINQPVPI